MAQSPIEAQPHGLDPEHSLGLLRFDPGSKLSNRVRHCQTPTCGFRPFRGAALAFRRYLPGMPHGERRGAQAVERRPVCRPVGVLARQALRAGSACRSGLGLPARERQQEHRRTRDRVSRADDEADPCVSSSVDSCNRLQESPWHRLPSVSRPAWRCGRLPLRRPRAQRVAVWSRRIWLASGSVRSPLRKLQLPPALDR